MKTQTILGAIFAAAVSLAPAGATTFLFPFNSTPGDLGSSSKSFTITVGAAQATITASTLVQSGTAPDLYAKALGTDENGLGTAGNTDHEIVPTDAIVLDFSAIHNISCLGIQMASVQAASMDGWQIYGSNTKPTTLTNAGTKLFTNTQTTDQELSNTFVSLPTNYTYLTIEVPAAAGCSPDVLLGGVEVMTAAPEPGTFLLLGLGALGLIAGRKFRRS